MAKRSFATHSAFAVSGPSAWVDDIHPTTVSKPLQAFQSSHAVSRQLMVTSGHHRGGGFSEEAEGGEPVTPFWGGSPPFWRDRFRSPKFVFVSILGIVTLDPNVITYRESGNVLLTLQNVLDPTQQP